eukprot:969970-Heterocapsa_arctica.AAC.1
MLDPISWTHQERDQTGISESERPGFKFYRRGDIRDTAAFFNQMKFMEPVEENIYTMEGTEGTFREHPVEVAGTILENILGLGALFEHYGYEELTEMPEIVTMLEAGRMSQNTSHRSRRIRRKEWLWDEYDEIWEFDMVPEGYPDYY